MGYLEESKQRDIFAKNLNKTLDDRGLRQRDVAIALDIAPTTFNTWTRGKAMPSVAVIRKIADYLGIGMSKLIDDQTDKESPLDFSYREVLLIEKYRKLGSEEKEAVDTMLDRISKYASLLSEEKEMTIEKTPNGKYRFREFFVDGITGKRKRYSVILDKNTPSSRKEALKILERKANLESNVRNYTLSELVELYFEFQKRTRKLSTAVRNHETLGRLTGILDSDALINNLTASYITNKLMQTGMSNSTLNEYIKRLKAFFRWCYQQEYLDSADLYQRLAFFKNSNEQKEEKRKYLEASEAITLIDSMNGINRDFVLFLLLSGCRSGEAIALTVNDIDSKKRTISINKTMDAVNKVVTTTKTETSEREIFMQDELLKFMLAYLHQRKETLVRLGIRTEYLFFSPSGKPLAFYTVNKYFKDHVKKSLGLDLTLHSLRHTHTSLLAESGIPLEEISRRLGHADSKITKEVYLHVTEKQKEKANERIKGIKLLGTS